MKLSKFRVPEISWDSSMQGRLCSMYLCMAVIQGKKQKLSLLMLTTESETNTDPQLSGTNNQ